MLALRSLGFFLNAKRVNRPHKLHYTLDFSSYIRVQWLTLAQVTEMLIYRLSTQSILGYYAFKNFYPLTDSKYLFSQDHILCSGIIMRHVFHLFYKPLPR